MEASTSHAHSEEGASADISVSKEEAFKANRGKFQEKVKKRFDPTYQERCYDELRIIYHKTGAKEMVYVDMRNKYGARGYDVIDLPNKEIFKALQQHRRLDDWKDKVLVVCQCIGGSAKEYQLWPSEEIKSSTVGQIFLKSRSTDSTFVGPKYKSTVTRLDEYANNYGGEKTRAAMAGMMLDAILKSQYHQPDFRAILSGLKPRGMERKKLAEGKEYLRKYIEEGDSDAYENGKTFVQDTFENGMKYFDELEASFKQGMESLEEYFKKDDPDVRKKGIIHLRKYFEKGQEPEVSEITLWQIENAIEAAVDFILLTQITEAVPPLGNPGGRTPGMDAYFRSALKQIVKSQGEFTFQDIYDHGIVTGKWGTWAGRKMADTSILHDDRYKLDVGTLRDDSKGLFRKIVDDMSDDEENKGRRWDVERCLDREETKAAEQEKEEKEEKGKKRAHGTTSQEDEGTKKTKIMKFEIKNVQSSKRSLIKSLSFRRYSH